MNPQLRRFALDLGPLFVFFVAFRFLGIYSAPPPSSWWRCWSPWHSAMCLERKLSPMPLFTAVLVMIFGGLTLYLKNDIFIKMKPTVALFAFRR